MHRMLLNRATIELALRPAGPVLIKAGESGVDPSLPDMRFVRTHRDGVEQVYFPGSSLKGAVRSHCERIARTFAGSGGLAEDALACDPLQPEKCCARVADSDKSAKRTAADKYMNACFVCQLFGNTSEAAHIAFDDAYCDGDPDLEERNGVAIDRVFGSVRHSPFQFETLVSGEFHTCIRLHNFTCAHMGLLAIALRDLQEQHLLIGFGKSRGLGRLDVDFLSLTLENTVQHPDGKRFLGVAANLPQDYRAVHTTAPWLRGEVDSVELPVDGKPDDLGRRSWHLDDTTDADDDTKETAIRSAFRAFADAWVQLFKDTGTQEAAHV